MMTDAQTRINRLKLNNFKSVIEADVQFAPLTLLIGSNSSGKSTLLQAILSLSQNAIRATKGTQFPLTGGFVNLGAFDDVLRQSAPEGSSIDIEMEMSLDERRVRQSGPWQRPHRWSPDLVRRGTLTLQVSLSASPRARGPASIVSSAMRLTTDGHEMLNLRIDRTRDSTESESDIPLAEPASSVSGFVRASEPEVEAGEPATTSFDVTSAALQAGIPARVTVLHEAHEYWARMLSRRLMAKLRRRPSSQEWTTSRRSSRSLHRLATFWSERQQNLLSSKEINDIIAPQVEQLMNEFAQLVKKVTKNSYSPEKLDKALDEFVSDNPEVEPLGVVIPELLDDILKGLGPSGHTVRDVPYSFVQNAVDASSSQAISILRDGIDYLGPIREEPQIAYKTQSYTSYGHIGVHGEYMAATFHERKNEVEQRPLPPLNENPTLKDLQQVRRATLEEAVNAWLKYFGIGSEVNTEDTGRLGLEFQLTREGLSKPVPLSAVGFGASQLMPIVMLCLLREPGTLIMIEQPELHQHPGAQQRLAEFLMAMVLSGRQIIVETHSEYTLNRLRLLVARDDSDTLSQLVRTLLVEQLDGATSYRQMDINEFGGLSEWPAGFFDQGAEDVSAMIRAAIAKRHAREG